MQISTILHLAYKLQNQKSIEDVTSFYLGCAYPSAAESSINGKADSYISSFDFGCYFSFWIENYFSEFDMGDISKYDSMICDMEKAGTIIEELRKNEYTGKEKEAMDVILSLEHEPMPLYLVGPEKKARYNEILDNAVKEFIESVPR